MPPKDRRWVTPSTPILNICFIIPAVSVLIMSSQSSFGDYIHFFDVFDDAILIYDSEKIHWVNQALVSLIGYDSREEVIGKNILSFLDPTSTQEATNQIQRLYQGVKITGGVYTVIKKDGTKVSVVSRGTQLPSSDAMLLISIVRPVEEDPIDADRGFSDFRVKHEISTSLTVVKGYVDLLKEKLVAQEDPDIDTWVECIF
jgi:PAS domain S-box-containing protein